MFLEDGPMTLVHFIHWMNVNCGVFWLAPFLWMFFCEGVRFVLLCVSFLMCIFIDKKNT